MLVSQLRFSSFFFSKIASSLKLLSLTPPTTKKQIKSRYIQLAKKLHPDSSSESQKTSSDKDAKNQNDAFIEITNAYKYLNELSESEINNPKTEEDTSERKQESKENYYYGPMTEEERRRRATEAYFTKKYRKNRPQEEMEKIPLYKQVPELFFGMFLVLIFLSDWAVMAYRRSHKSNSHKRQEMTEDTFKSLNFKKRYSKPEPVKQI